MDSSAPQYTAFTLDQAVSEARSALAVCKLSQAERIDCYRTLDIAVQVRRDRTLKQMSEYGVENVARYHESLGWRVAARREQGRREVQA